MSADEFIGYVLAGSVFFVVMGMAMLMLWAIYKCIKDD